MRKTFFRSALLVLLFLPGSGAFAQGYYRHFPTANALWSQGLMGVPEPYNYQDFTCTDTTFGEHTYTKVVRHYSNYGVESTFFLGGLREVGKQVFFYRVPDNLEFLLYDFSLQTGDTVQVKRIVSQQIDSFRFRVLSIDSVMLADGVHKRWKMKHLTAGQEKENWIEGIGSTTGLVDRSLGFINPVPPQLQDFQQNGSSIYTLPGFLSDNFMPPAECQEVVAVPNTGTLPAAVFPNPFSDHITISLPADYAHCTLSLYDCLGKLLRQADFFQQLTFTWQRDELPAGVYFLKIESRSGDRRVSMLKIVAL